MTRLVIGHDDPERLFIDFLTPSLDERGQQAGVGSVLPADWTPESGRKFVGVAWDGVPSRHGRVLFRASVRVTCWAGSRSEAKDLALLCEALLTAGGVPGTKSVGHLAGVLPTKDPDNGGDLAYFTVRANLPGRVL